MFRSRLARLCRPPLKADIEKRVADLSSSILRPLDRFAQLPKAAYSMPMVILLGNHSAGKSTFINSLLGLEEQQTGVAPTDDGFTVIMKSDADIDEDGPSAISNPANGLTELKQHGTSFVNHFRLKLRKLPESSRLPEGMMIVDTPGMIDTPNQAANSRKSVEGQNRGYNFLAVTKWFAQRSDVILLMFDPANPGTTGETLDVLTDSLSGQEHKFLILLNKVDVFDKVTDFARAYGTLCWNLSKVIRMKDVPRIYTTYTGVATASTNHHNSAVPLQELDRCRRDVIDQVLAAPLRRLDNLITEMEEAATKIRMAALVCNRIRRHYGFRRVTTMGTIAVSACVVPMAVAAVFPALELSTMIVALLGSACTVGSLGYVLSRQLNDYGNKLLNSLDEMFEEAVPKPITIADEQLWMVVKKLIATHAARNGIGALPSTRARDIANVKDLLDNDVPMLRGRVKEYKREMKLAADAADRHVK